MEWLNLHLFRRNDRVRRIKPNSKIAVNYFQQRRWQLITLLEQLSGFWPHQNKLQQYPLQLFHFLMTLTALLAVANKLREYVGIHLNNDTAIECCTLMLILLGLIVKLIFASIHQHNRRKVYERISKDFEAMRDSEEAAILNDGAEQGFKFTLYYMCIISVSTAIFNIVPALRAFYDYFFNHHELIMQLPMPMNYGFDHREYWYIIALHFLVGVCSCLLVQFTYDLPFILQVRHVAGLFQIVGIRIRKASEFANDFDDETMSEDAADESYSLISSAIDLHSECFEVVKLIEKSYSMSWFMLLLMTTGGLGAGVHLVSTKLEDPIETFRYTSGFLTLVMHFQVIFSQGQMIINSAESVLDACCELKWYRLPKKSCKLLTMMMIQTSIPCQLTGAKLFPLSMETFGKMLKAGLSYYTVFRPKSK